MVYENLINHVSLRINHTFKRPKSSLRGPRKAPRRCERVLGVVQRRPGLRVARKRWQSVVRRLRTTDCKLSE